MRKRDYVAMKKDGSVESHINHNYESVQRAAAKVDDGKFGVVQSVPDLNNPEKIIGKVVLMLKRDFDSQFPKKESRKGMVTMPKLNDVNIARMADFVERVNNCGWKGKMCRKRKGSDRKENGWNSEVVCVRPLMEYKIYVKFANGKEEIFDMPKDFDFHMATYEKDLGLTYHEFLKVFVNGTDILWPEPGVRFAGTWLYDKMMAKRKGRLYPKLEYAQPRENNDVWVKFSNGANGIVSVSGSSWAYLFKNHSAIPNFFKTNY